MDGAPPEPTLESEPRNAAGGEIPIPDAVDNDVEMTEQVEQDVTTERDTEITNPGGEKRKLEDDSAPCPVRVSVYVHCEDFFLPLKFPNRTRVALHCELVVRCFC